MSKLPRFTSLTCAISLPRLCFQCFESSLDGSFHLWIAHFLFSFRARQILISNGQQTLGVALPWGIAACLVMPHEKTLSISGDGGFLFSAMELETAVRLK